MNSQFKNSNFGFILYAFLIFVILATVGFVFWYMVTGYRVGTYDENTLLGSVYLGGLREEEVEPTMTTRIDRWKGDETIVFEATYQGYSFEFDRELFYFNITESLTDIVHGQQNQLLVDFLPGEKDLVLEQLEALPYLDSIDGNINFELLLNDILYDASFMKSISSIEIEDYLVDPAQSIGIVNETTMYVPIGINVDEMLLSINEKYTDGKIVVPEQELYDIIDELGPYLVDNELSILSTAMLQLVLETNFSINEIHYENKIDTLNYSIDTFPYYGHNATIFERDEISFSFYNPNDSDYYFTVEKLDEHNVALKLHGYEFINDINISINLTYIEHSTKTTNDERFVKDGQDGVVVEVLRTISNIENEVISDKIVIFEFYPPEVEVVID